MSYACMSWCWVKRRSGSKKLLKDFLTAASSVNLLESGIQNLVLKTQVKLLLSKKYEISRIFEIIGLLASPLFSSHHVVVL